MYMDWHINMDSFGDTCPSNWEEIADYLNAIIEAKEDLFEDGELTRDGRDFIEQLWEQYCSGDLPDAPKPVGINGEDEEELWYAVLRDTGDTDWGTGSHDREEALAMAREWREDGWEDAFVAVIDESGNEPMCVEEIRDIDE